MNTRHGGGCFIIYKVTLEEMFRRRSISRNNNHSSGRKQSWRKTCFLQGKSNWKNRETAL